jgi:hypothetical protein
MINIKVKGFGEAARKLRDLAQRTRELEGTHKLPTEDVFPAGFMSKYTDFPSFPEMLRASDFKAATPRDFEAIPADQRDSFVAAHTRFKNWKEMRETATREYVRAKLGL